MGTRSLVRRDKNQTYWLKGCMSCSCLLLIIQRTQLPTVKHGGESHMFWVDSLQMAQES